MAAIHAPLVRAEDNFKYAERMMPAVRAAIGSIPTRIFLDVDTAPIERDMHEATDLVIHLTGGDVAVRVRRRKSFWKHAEWSVRVRTKNGHRTEIDKLLDGFCRWYFTGYDDGGDGLFMWWLLDLDAVRASGILLEDWPAPVNPDGSQGKYISIDALEERGCVAYCGADTTENR